MVASRASASRAGSGSGPAGKILSIIFIMLAMTAAGSGVAVLLADAPAGVCGLAAVVALALVAAPVGWAVGTAVRDAPLRFDLSDKWDESDPPAAPSPTR